MVKLELHPNIDLSTTEPTFPRHMTVIIQTNPDDQYYHMVREMVATCPNRPLLADIGQIRTPREIGTVFDYPILDFQFTGKFEYNAFYQNKPVQIVMPSSFITNFLIVHYLYLYKFVPSSAWPSKSVVRANMDHCANIGREIEDAFTRLLNARQ